MAVIFQLWQPLLLMILLFVYVIPFCSCQLGNPQNIETFYPVEPPAPSPAPSNSGPAISPQPSASLPPAVATQPEAKSSSNTDDIVKAVAATAAGTLVLAALFFFVLQKYVIAPRRREKVGDNRPQGGLPVTAPNDLERLDGNLKGLIVDENGLDVVYWRRLQGGSKRNSFGKKIIRSLRDDGEEKGIVSKESRSRKREPIQEIPLLRGKSSSSYNVVQQETEDDSRNKAPSPPPRPPPPPSAGITFNTIEKAKAPVQPSKPSAAPAPPSPTPPPPPPPTRAPQPPPPPTSLAIQNKKIPATPPPPPPKPGVSAAAPKAPPQPRGTKPKETSGGETSTGTGNEQVKLKPLHWDKLNANADHSMVWDKMNGSFRFDGDLMEALFGYVASNRKSPPRSRLSEKSGNASSSSSAQIFILDARKSQNIAIVLKSLGMSPEEILDVLIQGHDADAETLEKLIRIAPTKEEQDLLLQFNGDPARLAAAESFLYHLLKAVPSAFTRLNALHFRSNYDSEILHLKDSLQTLELGCNELRARGLFMKLLEAILKAGNRMNAGTARGNAQAFNLTALRKLSDVKSVDGKTTLLHFVVEEVVRSEGKRCVLNRNRSLNRSTSKSNNSGPSSEDPKSEEEIEKEYVMLGLPVVGGLSSEFSNVKRAAAVDYDTFSATCSALSARAAEIQQLLSQCASNGEDGFAKKMKGFLESADEELIFIKEEQTRVMGLVKKTTEYYQAGAAKDRGAHPLHLFVVIKDFLGMVDQVCVEIARNLQKRKTATTGFGSSPPKSPRRTPVRFPILPENFMTDKSRSTSSESDLD